MIVRVEVLKMILKLDTIFYFLFILRIIHIQYIIPNISNGIVQGSPSFMYYNNYELYRSDYKYNISTIKLRVKPSYIIILIAVY